MRRGKYSFVQIHEQKDLFREIRNGFQELLGALLFREKADRRQLAGVLAILAALALLNL